MAFWHGRILPATYYFRGRGIVVITSENFDGEWIARHHRALRIRDRARIHVARRPQGAPAVDARHGRRPAGGFTVDGPRGPARVAQPGAVWLAKATGNPVLPFHLEADRHWTLKAGTGPRFPSRSPRVAIAMGEPFDVPPRRGRRPKRSKTARRRCCEAARSRAARKAAQPCALLNWTTRAQMQRCIADLVRTIRRASDAARTSGVPRARRRDGRRRRAMAAPGGEVVAPRPATHEQLARVHDGALPASGLRRRPGARSRSIPTPTRRPRRYEVALLAAGAAVDAVERVMGGPHAQALALVRPPGHHAERDRAMGFCFYNNVAVAAAHARALGRGSRRDRRLRRAPRQRHAAHVRGRSRRCCTSRRTSIPTTRAPARADEIGRGEGEGFTVNVPLEVGAADDGLPPGVSRGRRAGARAVQARPRCSSRRASTRTSAIRSAACGSRPEAFAAMTHGAAAGGGGVLRADGWWR